MRVLALELDRQKLRLGFWSLADQGVVSLGTFLLGLIVARSLPPAEYGVYALIWSVLLFLRGFHTSLVTYPLSVDWAKTEPGKLNALVGGSLVLTLAFGLPLMACAAVAALIVGRPGLVPWAMAALLAGHFQETTRRALMAALRHRATVPGDAVSYLGQVAAIGAVASSWQLSVEIAFAVMAVTSLVAGFIQLRQLGPPHLETCGVRTLTHRNWQLGRWLMLTLVLHAFANLMFPWALGLAHDAAEVGRYQAVLNFLGAINPLRFGLANVLVATAARARANGDLRASMNAVMWYGSVGAVLLVPYLGVLLLWPAEMLRLVYGAGSPYVTLGAAVRVLSMGCVLIYIAQIAEATLLGLERSRAVFQMTLVRVAFSVVPGLPLAAVYGLDGALAGILISHLAWVTIPLVMICRAFTRRHHTAAGSSVGHLR